MLGVTFIIVVLVASAQALQGGDRFSVKDIPYQVLFEFSDNDQSHVGIICGGTIVSVHEVLTSARCAIAIKMANATVRAGSKVAGSGGSVHTILKVVTHESYNRSSILSPYDVAVVRVREPMICKYCKAVKLARRKSRLLTDSTVQMSGFGEHNGTTGYLRAMNLTVGAQKKCNIMYEEYGGLPDGQRCAVAWDHQDNLVGPCRNDFGGPVVVEKKLVGLLVHGDVRCDSTLAAVFLELHHLHDWIDKHVTYDPQCSVEKMIIAEQTIDGLKFKIKSLMSVLRNLTRRFNVSITDYLSTTQLTDDSLVSADII